LAPPDQRGDSILDTLPDRKPMQNIQHLCDDMIIFLYSTDKASS